VGSRGSVEVGAIIIERVQESAEERERGSGGEREREKEEGLTRMIECKYQRFYSSI
jgi:hypothetical protein